MNVTYIQSDGQTDDLAWQYRALRSILASRGKNQTEEN